MKDRLLIATLAVLGFLVTLGMSAVREERWQPPPAPVPQAGAVRPLTPVPAIAAATLASAAPEASVIAPQDDGREAADSVPAPTYDEQAAARDRATAHSARSR
jgi:hypothetical protein